MTINKTEQFIGNIISQENQEGIKKIVKTTAQVALGVIITLTTLFSFAVAIKTLSFAAYGLMPWIFSLALVSSLYLTTHKIVDFLIDKIKTL
ncbi:hypothetical protein N9Y92_02655 [Chlamydiales bacterium]|nr:hypothetical protein [Chlamydiales bacterium]